MKLQASPTLIKFIHHDGNIKYAKMASMTSGKVKTTANLQQEEYCYSTPVLQTKDSDDKLEDQLHLVQHKHRIPHHVIKPEGRYVMLHVSLPLGMTVRF